MTKFEPPYRPADMLVIGIYRSGTAHALLPGQLRREAAVLQKGPKYGWPLILAKREIGESRSEQMIIDAVIEAS